MRFVRPWLTYCLLITHQTLSNAVISNQSWGLYVGLAARHKEPPFEFDLLPPLHLDDFICSTAPSGPSSSCVPKVVSRSSPSRIWWTELVCPHSPLPPTSSARTLHSLPNLVRLCCATHHFRTEKDNYSVSSLLRSLLVVIKLVLRLQFRCSTLMFGQLRNQGLRAPPCAFKRNLSELPQHEFCLRALSASVPAIVHLGSLACAPAKPSSLS